MTPVKKTQCQVKDCYSRSRYECPRCAIRYCSVECYRIHSDKCVAAFSSDADEGTRGVRVSERERRQANDRFRKALEELEEEHLPGANGVVRDGQERGLQWDELDGLFAEGDDDDDGCTNVKNEPEDVADLLEDLVEEMERLDLSYEEALQRLPQHMAREFHEMVRDGRIARFLPVWRPWWLQNASIEQSADSRSAEDEDAPAALPERPRKCDITCPVHLAQRRASNNIVYSVVDVVYAYCLTLRLHNGDCAADPRAAARMLWQSCGVIADDQRYTSMRQTLQACTERGAYVAKSKGAALEATADAAAVVGGRRDWVVRALWHVFRIYKEAEDAMEKARMRREVRRKSMKISFLLSWSFGSSDDVFLEAARQVCSFVAAEQNMHDEIDITRRALSQCKQNGGRTFPVLLPRADS